MTDRSSEQLTFVQRLSGARYRAWARLLHRFNLHHTQRIGPMEDGRYLHRCEWCGLRRTETPEWLTAKLMREAAESRK